jgi:segregation and condensation protein B
MGRPLLYGTTPAFLEQFALRHLGELPRADELAVALRDPNAPAPDPLAMQEIAEANAAAQEAEVPTIVHEAADSPYASAES